MANVSCKQITSSSLYIRFILKRLRLNLPLFSQHMDCAFHVDASNDAQTGGAQAAFVIAHIPGSSGSERFAQRGRNGRIYLRVAACNAAKNCIIVLIRTVHVGVGTSVISRTILLAPSSCIEAQVLREANETRADDNVQLRNMARDHLDRFPADKGERFVQKVCTTA